MKFQAEIQTIAEDIHTIAEEICRLMYFLYNFLSQTPYNFFKIFQKLKPTTIVGYTLVRFWKNKKFNSITIPSYLPNLQTIQNTQQKTRFSLILIDLFINMYMHI